jgi:hypothetical protein
MVFGLCFAKVCGEIAPAGHKAADVCFDESVKIMSDGLKQNRSTRHMKFGDIQQGRPITTKS